MATRKAKAEADRRVKSKGGKAIKKPSDLSAKAITKITRHIAAEGPKAENALIRKIAPHSTTVKDKDTFKPASKRDPRSHFPKMPKHFKNPFSPLVAAVEKQIDLYLSRASGLVNVSANRPLSAVEVLELGMDLYLLHENAISWEQKATEWNQLADKTTADAPMKLAAMHSSLRRIESLRSLFERNAQEKRKPMYPVCLKLIERLIATAQAFTDEAYWTKH